jgi:glutamate dehydrogenase (NAD(P)+)
MPGVTIQKLTTTDGFIAFDLDDAPSVGVTRSAPKILVDGASLLARSLTYRFATFERKIGGASAGINATPDARAAALAAYVAEVEPLARDARFLTEAAKGVSAADLAALRAVDPRPDAYWDLEDELVALGVATSADLALEGHAGLAGRTVAIEGFDRAGPALTAAIVERGGTVVAISTADGSAVDLTGLDPTVLAEGWAEHGSSIVGALAPEPAKPWAVFGTEADVLVVGSKPGVIDHEVAGGVRAKVVVPSAAVPVTAKALAVLRRAGTVVVPDFVSTAGPMFAGWPSGGASDPQSEARAAIGAVLTDALTHPEGPLLAACHRAEAFLLTWRDELPFGRPLA